MSGVATSVRYWTSHTTVYADIETVLTWVGSNASHKRLLGRL